MVAEAPAIQFPEKLKPLFEPHRYKVLYGGRGAGKSWAVARALLLQACEEPLRVLCAREIMRTIADSVHQLLSDQIESMGLHWFYTVQDATITGKNGASFIFAGLRQQDAHKIKSYEGVDVCWVEEAQTVSKRSWDILIPTIRAEGSEIWVTFNPDLDTDETYQRFVLRPPPGAWVQKLTWRDNPWFPDVLEAERRHLEKTDPDLYQHIWEGEPRTVVEGAIYSREIVRMIEERRIRPVPYDPQLPVHTIWDLGWNDQTSIIFCQRVLSEVRIIDYAEASFMRLDEWAKLVRDKPYVYGSHWLPHDGGHELQSAGGMSARRILTPLLGMVPRIIPRVRDKEAAIRAARMLFPRVYIDEERCARLIECLKRYRRAVPETTGEPGRPVHDEYSHGADAFGGLAMVADNLDNALSDVPRLQPFRPFSRAMGY